MAYRPWLDEPDTESFTHAGLECHILRQSKGGGHLCGYVELPPDSKWNELNSIMWDSPADVHGGITFGPSALTVDATRKYIGFDCAHLGDLAPNYYDKHGEIYGQETYRDINYVRKETMRLADQVAKSRQPVTANQPSSEVSGDVGE